jgi:hypothetical protein
MGTSWISKVSLQLAQTQLGLSENRVPEKPIAYHPFPIKMAMPYFRYSTIFVTLGSLGYITFPVRTGQRNRAPSLLNQKNVSGHVYSQWLTDNVAKHGA